MWQVHHMIAFIFTRIRLALIKSSKSVVCAVRTYPSSPITGTDATSKRCYELESKGGSTRTWADIVNRLIRWKQDPLQLLLNMISDWEAWINVILKPTILRIVESNTKARRTLIVSKPLFIIIHNIWFFLDKFHTALSVKHY